MYLMKFQASSLQFHFKKHHDADFFKKPFLAEFFRRLILTLQVHKVDKSVSRYCNKDINWGHINDFMSILKIFFHVEKFWKSSSRKSYQNFRYLQEKYLWWSFFKIRYFIEHPNNFIYDSEEDYDLMKPYFDTLLEILAFSLILLYRLS